MCTLIVATRVWPQQPLVVAANRDERLGRAAVPPALHEQDGLGFFAPRDLQAGGTWLGVNRNGVVVAITNRYPAQANPDARSRGLLVLDALAAESVEDAVHRVAGEQATRYQGFHLVIADVRDAHVVWNDGARLHHEHLAPGIHVITERSFGAAPSERVARLRGEIAATLAADPPTAGRWMEILRAHAEPGFEGTCVHVPGHDYATRSSSIVTLSGDPPRVGWLAADGPPCTHPFTDLSPLASRVLATSE